MAEFLSGVWDHGILEYRRSRPRVLVSLLCWIAWQRIVGCLASWGTGVSPLETACFRVQHINIIRRVNIQGGYRVMAAWARGGKKAPENRQRKERGRIGGQG